MWNKKIKFNILRDIIEGKAIGVTLGDEQLNKEFGMQEAAREILEEEKSKKAR